MSPLSIVRKLSNLADRKNSGLRTSSRQALRSAVNGKPFESLEGRLLFSSNFLFTTGMDGFKPTGNVSLEDNNYYSPVVGGGGATGQVLVATGAAVNGGGPVVSAASLENTLGLAAGTLTGQGAVNGSAFVAPGYFTATMGATVTLDADFLTNNEPPAGDGQADFAIAYLRSSTGAVTTQTIAKVGTTTMTQMNGLNELGTGYDYETASGGSLITLTVPSTGSYTLGVVVAAAGAGGASGVLLNNVTLPAGFNNFYDFGTASSPIATGYTGVASSALYSAGAGYGFTSGTIGNVKDYDTTDTPYVNPDPNLTRDFVYSYNGNYEVSGLTNGLYDVTLTVGDARGYTYNNEISFGAGNPSDDIVSGAATSVIVNKTYQVQVTAGVVNLAMNYIGGTSSYTVLDGMTIVPDVSSFQVTSSTPATGSTVSGSFSTIPISFNHSINAANDLTGSNYVLTNTGASTSVSPTSVTETSTQSVLLTFASPITAGSYSLSFSGNVEDTGNNPLNPATPITFTETAATVPINFDMGTAASPVAPGYTQVTQATAYSAANGYGWASTAGLLSYNTGIANSDASMTNLTEDFVYTSANASTTFDVNVANGNYDVTVDMGDARSYAYASNIYFQGSGTPTDNIATTTSNPLVSKTYFVTVSGGQLQVGFTGTNNSDVVVDGISYTRDLSQFGVSSSTPTSGGTVAVPTSQVVVNFNRPLNTGSDLQASDYPLTGNSTTIFPTSVVESNGNQTVTLTYAPIVQAGSYSLDVSAVVDAAGDSTVQTGTPITFSATGSIPTAPTKYNFGPASAPAVAGWTLIPHTNTFNSTSGYGYLPGGTGTIADYDTGNTAGIGGVSAPAGVTRDFNYWSSGTNTFGVTVANGTYSVTLIVGDARNYFYSAAVYFQGSGIATATINTGVGSGNSSEVSQTFSVVVSNNQLQIGLGVVKNDAVLDGLSFVKTG